MRAKGVFVTLILIVITFFSLWCAELTYSTDFASFYRAASIALDDSRPVSDIYRIDDRNIAQYNMPDNEHFVEYRYSVFATYLISPLAILDYDTANAAMIFINIICYAIAVILLLRARGAQGRWFLYPLALSVLWIPFIQNIRWGQVNAIILLLVTLAVLQARKNSFFVPGILLAVATLIKPFVLAITMVLLIKNWRIVIGYISLISIALLLPGTREWLYSFLWPPHSYFCYSAVYRYLENLGPYYFWIYAAIIGLTTAAITFYHHRQDYLSITALAVSAALLAMPVLEIHHPVVLIFAFTSLVTQRMPNVLRGLTVISFILISMGSATLNGGYILYLGIFILWLIMISVLYNDRRRELVNGR